MHSYFYYRRLQDSERIALETEEQGAGILSSLRRQREQIENSRDQVRLLSVFLPSHLPPGIIVPGWNRVHGHWVPFADIFW